MLLLGLFSDDNAFFLVTGQGKNHLSGRENKSDSDLFIEA